MNPQTTRMFIEQVINAPSIPAAQWLVESNLQMLDATFFQVLQVMAQEAQVQAQSRSNLYLPNMPDFLADQLINQQEQASQRLQALQMLNQYAAARVQSQAWQTPAAAPINQLQVTCPNCGNAQVVFCPGYGLHPPAATVVADPSGGRCTVCHAQFNSVNCACGAQISLLPNAPSTDNAPAANHTQPPQQEPSNGDSLQQMFELLNRKLNEEKNKGYMDEARQSGLESVMERLSSLVNDSARDRSLQEMANDRGKLNELMTDMLHRIKKPTYASGSLNEGTRAARIFALLNDLKSYVANETMRQQKSKGETEKLMDLFLRLGHLVTYVHQSQDDAQKLISLEQDQARGLANEVRLYARRHCLILARPTWTHGDVKLNPNLLFYSGPAASRAPLERMAIKLKLELNPSMRPGADVDESRWHDLRVASVAVFDISMADPQVFYELGIALALGTELLLIAQQGSELPFDIAQNVRHYDALSDLENIFATELDGILYGLQTPSVAGSSLEESVAYVERLAAEAGDKGLLHVALNNLRLVSSDPIQLRSALDLLNPFLGQRVQSLLYPRWPGLYPNPEQPRCFIIMPFREELGGIYSIIEHLCNTAHIDPIRGDTAQGPEIISSIWEEIGRATHITVDLTDFNPNVCLELGIADTLGRNTLLIARQGTEKQLERTFPSIAKRRCHLYPESPEKDAEFIKQLQGFLRRC